MTYEIVNIEGAKAVRFHFDGNGKSRNIVYPVNYDDNGMEYVFVPNHLNWKGFFTFIGRIKDAVEQIRSGIGDCIQAKKYSFESPLACDVIMYLDREYGNSVKKKFIEGFKDAKFGYSICGEYATSLNGSVIFDCTGNPADSIYGHNPFIFFNTIEEAQEKVDEWKNRAKNIGLTYEMLDMGKPWQEWFERITIDTPYVISCLSNNYYSKSEAKYEIEIIQAIKEE